MNCLIYKKCYSNKLKAKGILLIYGNFLEQIELVQTTNDNDRLLHKIIEYIGKTGGEYISVLHL